MHKAAGMHLIRTCTCNEVGSCYVLAFGSWITFVSCNVLRVTLHIGLGDRTMNKKTVVILIGMIIVDSYQRLKDPYNCTKGHMANSTLWALWSRLLHAGPMPYRLFRHKPH